MAVITSDAEPPHTLNEEDDAVYLASLSGEFNTKFNRALEAIKSGKMTDLRAAVVAMQQDTCVSKEECVNVIVKVPGPKKDPTLLHPMSLLAFAAYYARREMMDFLIDNNARLDTENQFIGNPFLQMLGLARVRENPQQLDRSIVKFFINDERVVLSRVLNAGYARKSTALELSIFLGCFDITKLLIYAGFDPIYGGNPSMRPIFIEYVHYQSNNFLKWLLGEHLKDEIPEFVNRILPDKVFCQRQTKFTATKFYGTNPVHTFLLCYNGKVVDCLLQRKPDILTQEVDPFGKTALHLAAENGDTENLKILLDRKANVHAKDKSSMTPLMLATKQGHTQAIEMLLVKMVTLEEDGSGTVRSSDPMGMWAWALQYGYTAYFEAMHKTKELERHLLHPLDTNGNNIAHIAAEGGHTAIFKATFPKVHEPKVYEILLTPNGAQKTPLMLAIEKGHVRILRALLEQRAERKKRAAENIFSVERQVDSVEEKDLKKLWEDESLELLLYACEHGTVDVVKYFITELVIPYYGLDGDKRLTPLFYAAKAGKDEIVTYLLSIEGVSPDGEKDSLAPLMIASMHGHAKCVTRLLEKEADVGVKSERHYNCLMESIMAGHEDVARAILTHPWQDQKKWKKTMEVCVRERDKFVTPMRMLIEHMPDVAKLVLTNCITEGEVESQGTANLEAGNEKCLKYDFRFVEDFRETGTVTEWGPTEFVPSCHPLTYMVNHERLDLLQHPLVSRYISYKWWKQGFPAFLIYIICYSVFFIFLISFSLILPRPSPNNEFCPNIDSEDGYTKLTFRDGECRDPDSVNRRAFAALAVILILMSVVFLLFEFGFRYVTRKQKKTFFAHFEAIFRIGTFLFTIIFVFGFVNKCWCAPPWQWQIGALTVFMAHINGLLLLKGLPKWGVYINMLLNIVITFLQLFYLPLLLVSAFAFPFYMLFVRDGAAVQGNDGPGILEAFSTPAHSIAKTIMQTAGELDFEAIFNDANLLYSPMAYILFISFVVLMPILFSNMLVGLAVGTADEDKKNATFTNIQRQVDFILGLESFQMLRSRSRCTNLECKKNVGSMKFMWEKLLEVDYASQEKLLVDIDKDTDESSKEKVTRISLMVHAIQEKIPALERSHKELQETLEKIVHMQEIDRRALQKMVQVGLK